MVLVNSFNDCLHGVVSTVAQMRGEAMPKQVVVVQYTNAIPGNQICVVDVVDVSGPDSRSIRSVKRYGPVSRGRLNEDVFKALRKDKALSQHFYKDELCPTPKKNPPRRLRLIRPTSSFISRFVDGELAAQIYRTCI